MSNNQLAHIGRLCNVTVKSTVSHSGTILVGSMVNVERQPSQPFAPRQVFAECNSMFTSIGVMPDILENLPTNVQSSDGVIQCIVDGYNVLVDFNITSSSSWKSSAQVSCSQQFGDAFVLDDKADPFVDEPPLMPPNIKNKRNRTSTSAGSTNPAPPKNQNQRSTPLQKIKNVLTPTSSNSIQSMVESTKKKLNQLSIGKKVSKPTTKIGRSINTANGVTISMFSSLMFNPSDFDGFLAVHHVPSSPQETVNVYTLMRTSPSQQSQNKGMSQAIRLVSSESLIEMAFPDINFKFHDTMYIAHGISKYCSFDNILDYTSRASMFIDDSPAIDALCRAINKCPPNELAMVLVTEHTRVCLTLKGYKHLSGRIESAHPSGKDFVHIYSLEHFGLSKTQTEELIQCNENLWERRKKINKECSARLPQKSLPRKSAKDEKEQERIYDYAIEIKDCLRDIDTDEYTKAADALKRGNNITKEEAKEALEQFAGVWKRYDAGEISLHDAVAELNEMIELPPNPNEKFNVIICRCSQSTGTQAQFLAGTNKSADAPLRQISLCMTKTMAIKRKFVIASGPEVERNNWMNNIGFGKALHLYFKGLVAEFVASNPIRVSIVETVIRLVGGVIPLDFRECYGIAGEDVVIAEGLRQDSMTRARDVRHQEIEAVLEKRSKGIQRLADALNAVSRFQNTVDQSTIEIPSGLDFHAHIMDRAPIPNKAQTPIHIRKPDPAAVPTGVARVKDVQFTSAGEIVRAQTVQLRKQNEKMKQNVAAETEWSNTLKSLGAIGQNKHAKDTPEIALAKKKFKGARTNKNNWRKKINGEHAKAVERVCDQLIKQEKKKEKKKVLKNLKKNLEEDTEIAKRGQIYSGKPKPNNKHDSNGCKTANVTFTRWVNEGKNKSQIVWSKKDFFTCKAYDSLTLALDGTSGDALGDALVKHLEMRYNEKCELATKRGSRVCAGQTKGYLLAQALYRMQSKHIVKF